MTASFACGLCMPEEIADRNSGARIADAQMRQMGFAVLSPSRGGD